MIADSVPSAKTAELVAWYNAHSGKPPIKKFADRAKAEARVLALIAATAPPAPAPTPAPAPSSQPAGQQRAPRANRNGWADTAVAAARALRHGVRVNGTEYRSVREAFRALGLPDNKHVRFRLELKSAGKAEFAGHKFQLVE